MHHSADSCAFVFDQQRDEIGLEDVETLHSSIELLEQDAVGCQNVSFEFAEFLEDEVPVVEFDALEAFTTLGTT